MLSFRQFAALLLCLVLNFGNLVASSISNGGGGSGIPFGPTIIPAPLVAALTWVNQGTATASNPDHLLLMQDTGNNGNLRLLKKAAVPIAGNFTLTLWVQPTLPATQNTRVGMAFREAGTGKIQAFFLIGGGATGGNGTITTIDCWASATNFSNASSALNLTTPSPGFGTWMRMTYDGTNIISSLSGDGEYFYTVSTKAKTDCFTAAPDEIGAAISPSNGSSVGVAESVISWKES